MVFLHFLQLMIISKITGLIETKFLPNGYYK